jgi:hypothetical protein
METQQYEREDGEPPFKMKDMRNWMGGHENLPTKN